LAHHADNLEEIRERATLGGLFASSYAIRCTTLLEGSMLIEGHTHARFSGLRDAFAASFADGLEHGASVAVVLNGEIVAELWGGHADAAQTKPYAADTLVNVWSCTKGVVATAVAIAVERGLLRYDEPIAKLWPAFAAHGKDKVTLGHVLSHTAGVNGFGAGFRDEMLFDWQAATALLADLSPNWEPGKRCAYHALTYGHLAGEVLRRATGHTVGAFIRTEIAQVMDADFHIGVSEANEPRCAEMIEGPKTYEWVKTVQSSAFPQACKNPAPLALWPNDRRWRAAEIPGGNGYATALGLAKIYGDLSRQQPRLMRCDTVEDATRVRFRGMDESFAFETVWAAGFSVEDPDAYGSRASLKTIGHGGWGGSLGFGDPEARLGFAYVTNRMLGFDDGIDPRRARCVAAVYDALG
jgi:CubicO group peptidase (beta-lactamase class C family)